MSASAASWGHAPSSPPQGSQLLGELENPQAQWQGLSVQPQVGGRDVKERAPVGCCCAWARSSGTLKAEVVTVPTGMGKFLFIKWKWEKDWVFSSQEFGGTGIIFFLISTMFFGIIIQKNILLVPAVLKIKTK